MAKVGTNGADVQKLAVNVLLKLQEYAGFWRIIAKYWQGDAGYWTLDTGNWMLDAGYWILDAGYWVLDKKTIGV